MGALKKISCQVKGVERKEKYLWRKKSEIPKRPVWGIFVPLVYKFFHFFPLLFLSSIIFFRFIYSTIGHFFSRHLSTLWLSHFSLALFFSFFFHSLLFLILIYSTLFSCLLFRLSLTLFSSSICILSHFVWLFYQILTNLSAISPFGIFPLRSLNFQSYFFLSASFPHF